MKFEITNPAPLLAMALLLLATATASTAHATATPMVHPTAIVLDKNQRSAIAYVINRGESTGTFAIELVDNVMLPDGRVVAAEDESSWSIQPLVRYSPRRVTLTPGQTQTIKIAIRRRADTPEGEYFSHLRVLTLSDDTEAETRDAAADPAGTVTVDLRTAIAIPLIWRNSDQSPAAKITEARIDANTRELVVIVSRLGPLSVRGYVHVLAGSGDSGAPVGEPSPLVIYPNIDSRETRIALPDDGVRANTSALTIVLSESEDWRTDPIDTFQLPSQ